MSKKKEKLLDLKNTTEPEKEERKDPTSFLPEEPMSYEIKKKKKKKKKNKEHDPFQDIQEPVWGTDKVTILEQEEYIGLDPEVSIKVENIDVDLDFDDFTNNDGFMPLETEISQEPAVSLEQDNKEAVLLTFESIINNKDVKIKEEQEAEVEENGPVVVSVSNKHMCKVCHLVFKNHKTLRTHQQRQHKLHRRKCKHICKECGMAYEARNSLLAHIKRRHGPNVDNDKEDRTCEECSLVFKGMTRLRMHMRRKHGAFADTFKHVCKDCGLTYEKSSSLLVHRRRKHSIKKQILEQWITCPFCSKMYRNRETYARHIQRSHYSKENETIPQANTNEAGEIVCSQCPLVFTSTTFLKIHMRRKHNCLIEDFRYKCQICQLSYNKVESLKRHVQRKHDKRFYCKICNKQFTSEERYIGHTHVPLKQVKECNICGNIFASQGHLIKHKRILHNIETPKTIFCHVCNEGFWDRRQLRPHVMREHYNVTYTCNLCKYSFKTREIYRRHMIVKHPKLTFNECVHKCGKCSATFTDEFELCNHLNLVHNEDTKPVIKKEQGEEEVNPERFQCLKCDDRYPSLETLRTHYEQNHKENIVAICQICGEKTTQAELQKHIKQNHSESQELECRFCNFKTANRFTMTQHMLRHKDATTLNCDYPNCRYKTFYVNAMEKHKKKHQDNTVRLQCTQCPFQTMNKYVLKYHEQAHDKGTKRHKCDKCDYATNLPANLIQHKSKHSTEKRFKCELCPFASKYNTSLRFHVKKKHCDLPI